MVNKSISTIAIIFVVMLINGAISNQSHDLPDLENANSIHELNLNNFGEALSKYKNIYVAFYLSESDWDSLNVNQNFIELAKRLFEYDPKIYFAKCKLTKEIEVANFAPKTFDRKVPINFILYTDSNEKIRNDNVINENPQHYEASTLFAFVKQQYIQYISTAKEIDRFIRKNIPIIFIYFYEDINSENVKTFKSASRSPHFVKNNVKFILADYSLSGAFGCEVGDVLIRKKIDEKEIRLADGFTEELLVDMVVLHEKTFYNSIDIIQQSFNSHIPLLIMFRDEKHLMRKTLEEIFRRAYVFIKYDKPNIDQILNFAIGGFSKSIDKDLAEYIKLTNNEDVMFALIDTRHQEQRKWKTYFMQEQEFDHKNIINFVDNFFTNKLVYKMLSEEVNRESPEGPGYLNYLVGTTFDKWVIEQNLDALVLLYADGCQACDMFMDTYIKFWEEYQESNPDLFFGAFNAVKNDNFHINPLGYPEVHFFKVGEKENPIFFDGDKSYKSLVDFVKKHFNLKPKQSKTTTDSSSKKKEEM